MRTRVGRTVTGTARPAATSTLAWSGAAAALTAALVAPALFNGFPVVFHDTGGYLAAAVEGRLHPGRAVLYGAFLELGIASQFWTVILVQAAVTVWLLALSLRVHGLGGRPWLLVLVGGGLAALTSLPWYAAQLMPDIWVPGAVAALYMLACRSGWLRLWEKAGLGAVAAFAAASHMATMALAVGLVAALAVLRLIAPRLRLPRPRLAPAAVAVAAGIAGALGSNWILAGKAAFTPGGVNFLFGRLIETGLVVRYLDDNCPDPTIRLCLYRHHKLPDVGDVWLTSGDAWLWYEASPFHALGGWDGFAGEAGRFVVGTLRAYPLAHLRAAIDGTAKQFVMVGSGDGLTEATDHTGWAIETMAPGTARAYRAARQQQRGYDFGIDNLVHVPVALATTALLPAFVWLVRRRKVRPAAGMFAAVVLLALLGNAAICGALANPHHRYQSRLVPLAPLAIAVALASWRRRSPMLLAAGRRVVVRG